MPVVPSPKFQAYEAIEPSPSVEAEPSKATVRPLGVEPKDELTSAYTAEEVRSIVAESAKEGLITDDQGLISGALEFSDLLARDVMVPRDRLVTVPHGCTPEEVERLVTRTGYSRFPVVAPDGAIDGYLHLKDLLYADDERHTPPVPFIVP